MSLCYDEELFVEFSSLFYSMDGDAWGNRNVGRAIQTTADIHPGGFLPSPPPDNDDGVGIYSDIHDLPPPDESVRNHFHSCCILRYDFFFVASTYSQCKIHSCSKYIHTHTCRMTM